MSTIRRPHPRRRAGAISLAAAIFLLVPACTFHGLSFVQDERVRILTPADREVIEPPFTLRWTVEDFDAGPGTLGSGDNYFAVFVDRQPLPPGEHVRELGDDACKRDPACPDVTWLSQHRVHVTVDNELTLTALPRILPPTTRAGAKERHEIVIVLMDGRDRRIGEYAYWVEVFRTIRGFGG